VPAPRNSVDIRKAFNAKRHDATTVAKANGSHSDDPGEMRPHGTVVDGDHRMGVTRPDGLQHADGGVLPEATNGTRQAPGTVEARHGISKAVAEMTSGVRVAEAGAEHTSTLNTGEDSTTGEVQVNGARIQHELLTRQIVRVLETDVHTARRLLQEHGEASMRTQIRSKLEDAAEARAKRWLQWHTQARTPADTQQEKDGDERAAVAWVKDKTTAPNTREREEAHDEDTAGGQARRRSEHTLRGVEAAKGGEEQDEGKEESEETYSGYKYSMERGLAAWRVSEVLNIDMREALTRVREWGKERTEELLKEHDWMRAQNKIGRAQRAREARRGDDKEEATNEGGAVRSALLRVLPRGGTAPSREQDNEQRSEGSSGGKSEEGGSTVDVGREAQPNSQTQTRRPSGLLRSELLREDNCGESEDGGGSNTVAISTAPPNSVSLAKRHGALEHEDGAVVDTELQPHRPVDDPKDKDNQSKRKRNDGSVDADDRMTRMEPKRSGRRSRLMTSAGPEGPLVEQQSKKRTRVAHDDMVERFGERRDP